jgi:Flp pilus assembly protein TadD
MPALPRMRRIISIFLLSICAVAQSDSIEAALSRHQFDQALLLIREALQTSPKDGRLLTLEGIALGQTGKKQEALKAFDQALAVAPNNLAALEGAAQLEYEAKSKRAIPLLNRILAQQPSNLTSHAMLAILSYQQRDCSEAVKHFAASESMIESQAPALRAYGSCLMRLERPADAVHVFEKIAAVTPDDPHARYNLAVVQLAADQSKQSVETLQPLLESSPDGDVLDLASAVYENVGDTPRAVSLLRQAIVANPQKEKYYVDFATLSYNHDSFQVGIDVLNAGIQTLPKTAGLYTAWPI